MVLSLIEGKNQRKKAKIVEVSILHRESYLDALFELIPMLPPVVILYLCEQHTSRYAPQRSRLSMVADTIEYSAVGKKKEERQTYLFTTNSLFPNSVTVL